MTGGASKRAPGSDAPCLALPAFWNSMTRSLLKCSGQFSGFLRSSLQFGDQTSPTPYTWPCPLPYAEACDDEWSPGLWRKRLLNLTVAMLNFLHLGRPSLCPPAVRLGTPLNRRQWAAVSGLQHLVFGSFFLCALSPLTTGGLATRLRGRIVRSRRSPGTCQKADAPTSPHQGPVPVEAVGSLPGKPDVAALPIVADRVKLLAKPCFRPQPYMDSTTKEFYDYPLRFARRPEPGVDQPPFVKILADRTQTAFAVEVPRSKWASSAA